VLKHGSKSPANQINIARSTCNARADLVRAGEGAISYGASRFGAPRFEAMWLQPNLLILGSIEYRNRTYILADHRAGTEKEINRVRQVLVSINWSQDKSSDSI
jgi:hypothetical protein